MAARRKSCRDLARSLSERHLVWGPDRHSGRQRRYVLNWPGARPGRVGIASEILALICATALAMIYFVLLRPVSKELNLLATFFTPLSLAVGARIKWTWLWIFR